MAEQEHSNHHHFYCLYLFGEREFLSQMQTEESAYTIVLFGSSLAWESHLEPGQKGILPCSGLPRTELKANMAETECTFSELESL